MEKIFLHTITMQKFPSSKARKVLKALQKIGWEIIRETGSHKTLRKKGYENYTFAFHDKEEIGPVMLKKIADVTGLTPYDL